MRGSRGSAGPPGLAALDDHAAVHEQHLVATRLREADLVGDHHHGPALDRQILHDGQHLPHQFRVESRGRLVEEHQLRLERQRAGDADALLLSARELVRVLVGLAGETDLVQQLLRLGPYLGRRSTSGRRRDLR